MKVNEELWNEFIKGNIVVEIKRNKIKEFLKECLNLGLKYTNFYKSMWASEIQDMIKNANIVDDEIFYYEVYTGHKEDENKNPLLICFDDEKTNNKKTIKYSELFTEDKPLKEDREYSASELIHMIEENKLNNEDKIIDREGTIIVIKNFIKYPNYIKSIINNAPYKIKKYEEPKYVTFDEAVKSGKEIRYDENINFNTLDNILAFMAITNTPNDIKRMLSEKIWQIKKD